MANENLCAAINWLYTLLVEIGFLESSYISWPPHNDPKLPIDLLRETGYDEYAIEFLSSIPLPKDAVELRPETECIEYFNTTLIPYTRIPQDMDQPLEDNENERLPASQLAITTAINRESASTIVDAKNCKVYDWYFQYADLDEVEAQDAVVFFKELADCYESLKLIPTPDCGWLDEEDEHYSKTKQMLLDYGWPKELRRQQFLDDFNDAYTEWRKESGFQRSGLTIEGEYTKEKRDAVMEKNLESIWMNRLTPELREQALREKAQREAQEKEAETALQNLDNMNMSG